MVPEKLQDNGSDMVNVNHFSTAPVGACGLLTAAAFRQCRDAYAQASMRARLSDLEVRAKLAWADYLAGRQAIEAADTGHQKQELANRLYAEDGAAWAWAGLDADIGNIRRGLLNPP